MGNYCFCGCSSLESVKLPNKRINIVEGAFEKCYNLKTIDFPQTVENIRKNAFKDCIALENFTFSNGSNLKLIESEAFYGCSSLNGFLLPDTLTEIGSSAFKKCVTLSFVDLLKNLKYIRNNAFADFTSLENFTFSKGSNLNLMRIQLSMVVLH